ncbi:hypothetical protein DEJ28_09030 [Curtobacterium sp. MCPF17_002]|uniref:hypothetical protein n=1 Tax=Curtobacterium sp. MCPF17_002 TaxID=2175645 RepID=UPI0015E8B9B0|nr:hypothetical protein [Curtobacterium sp. MCPF17_002]WIB75841.1 hypothetical protein DEJ28_09030 [Curtobacterium sp. MCPF17_002]
MHWGEEVGDDGQNAVFVHALGEMWKFAVYNPSDMLKQLDRLREFKPRVVR